MELTASSKSGVWGDETQQAVLGAYTQLDWDHPASSARARRCGSSPSISSTTTPRRTSPVTPGRRHTVDPRVGRVDVARQLRSTHTGGLVDDVTARERLTSAVETRMPRSRE